jgi:hypothetical protein
MYVCPCIIYENDERYQLDATILFIINNSTCFGHLYAHLQEYRLYTTAYGVQHKTTHRLLRTSATTPRAEHHMQ